MIDLFMAQKALEPPHFLVQRWAKHSDSAVNRTSINNESINRLPKMECNAELDGQLSLKQLNQ